MPFAVLPIPTGIPALALGADIALKSKSNLPQPSEAMCHHIIFAVRLSEDRGVPPLTPLERLEELMRRYLATGAKPQWTSHLRALFDHLTSEKVSFAASVSTGAADFVLCLALHMEEPSHRFQIEPRASSYRSSIVYNYQIYSISRRLRQTTLVLTLRYHYLHGQRAELTRKLQPGLPGPSLRKHINVTSVLTTHSPMAANAGSDCIVDVADAEPAVHLLLTCLERQHLPNFELVFGSRVRTATQSVEYEGDYVEHKARHDTKYHLVFLNAVAHQWKAQHAGSQPRNALLYRIRDMQQASDHHLAATHRYAIEICAKSPPGESGWTKLTTDINYNDHEDLSEPEE